MKEYIKPELQVREIRVEENLANSVDWSVNALGEVVTKYGSLTALTAAGSGTQPA